ncbi:phage major capsid protein [Paracoccus sp. DMF-8]|uniref:phage major capsid protein n=1 Tax=Paracoccus sp. DMF-8 TaxID=3019445 RepID=UPI0023E85C82|nr:phage major capsid protein [Paracoccus sp. DMF-8]MDF3606322.1 phage major capsid protein [Paracoccus sp. DMF-8]
MAPYAEQIAAFEAALETRVTRLKALADAATEKGETFDAEAREEVDTLKGEVKSLNQQIADLKEIEAMVGATAKPVDGSSAKAASDSRDPRVPAQVKAAEKLDPGIAVARIARAKAVAAVKGMTQREAAATLYGENSSTYGVFAKAAVAPALTTTPSWAGNLVGDEGSVYADFIEYLRPQTILGRFGNNGIPSLRNVGFRTPLIGQTTGGSGYWVGEGQAKPLTKFDFSRTTLEPLKVANIAIASKEVLEYSNPSADGIIRDSLVAALRERLDIDFIDPTKSAVSGVSPASITNGITAIPSSGVDADAVRADIRAIFAAFIAANNAPTSGVWIMAATQALSLSLMLNPLGATGVSWDRDERRHSVWPAGDRFGTRPVGNRGAGQHLGYLSGR